MIYLNGILVIAQDQHRSKTLQVAYINDQKFLHLPSFQHLDDKNNSLVDSDSFSVP